MSILSYIKKFHDEDNFEDFDDNLVRGYKLLNSDRPYMVLIHLYHNETNFLSTDMDVMMLDNELHIINKYYDDKDVISDDVIASYENNGETTESITRMMMKHYPPCQDERDGYYHDHRYITDSEPCYTHLYVDDSYIHIVNEHGCRSIPHHASEERLYLLYKSSVLATWSEDGRLFIKMYEDNIQFDVVWPYTQPDSAVIYNDCLYISNNMTNRMMVINLRTKQCVVLKMINPVNMNYHYTYCTDDGRVYLICDNDVLSFRLPSWEVCLSIGEYMEDDKPIKVELQCSDGSIFIKPTDVDAIPYLVNQRSFNTHSGQTKPLSVETNSGTMMKILDLIHHQPNYNMDENLQLLEVVDYLQCNFAKQIICSNLVIEGYDISCIDYIEEVICKGVDDVAMRWLDFHRKSLSDEQLHQIRLMKPSIFYKVFRNEVEWSIHLKEVDDVWMLAK